MQCRVVRKITKGHWKFNRKLTKVGESRRKRDSVVLEDAHPASERKMVQFVHGTYASFWRVLRTHLPSPCCDQNFASASAKPLPWPQRKKENKRFPQKCPRRVNKVHPESCEACRATGLIRHVKLTNVSACSGGAFFNSSPGTGPENKKDTISKIVPCDSSRVRNRNKHAKLGAHTSM